MDSVDDAGSTQSASDEVLTKAEITVTCVCDQHLEASFYCEDHAEVICTVCKTLKHTDCTVATVTEKSIGYTQTEVSALLKKAKELKVSNDNFVSNKTLDLERLRRMKGECITGLQNYRKEINQLLDRLEKHDRDQLDKLESEQRQKLEGDISTSELVNKMLNADIGLLRDVIETDDSEKLFAANVKVANRLKHCSSSLELVFERKSSPMPLFKSNASIIEDLKTVNGLGTLTMELACSKTSSLEKETINSSISQKNAETFLNLKVASARRIELKVSGERKQPDIKGCAFTSEGEVVLCDVRNKAVMVLNTKFSPKEWLDFPEFPCDVAILNKHCAIVTVPLSKQLQFIEVAPKLKHGLVIQLDKRCWGVDVAGENIYTSCHSLSLFGSRDGEVRVLDMQGNLKRKIGVYPDGSCMFCYPFYLAASRFSGRVFVTDGWNGSITCLESDASIVYQYTEENLSFIRGVSVDDEDNAVVCGRNSNNVKTITSDGKLHQTLLTNVDIHAPQCVARRLSGSGLIIACRDSKNMYIVESTH